MAEDIAPAHLIDALIDDGWHQHDQPLHRDDLARIITTIMTAQNAALPAARVRACDLGPEHVGMRVRLPDGEVTTIDRPPLPGDRVTGDPVIRVHIRGHRMTGSRLLNPDTMVDVLDDNGAGTTLDAVRVWLSDIDHGTPVNLEALRLLLLTAPTP